MRPHETRTRTTTPTHGALEGNGPPVGERRGERGRARAARVPVVVGCFDCPRQQAGGRHKSFRPLRRPSALALALAPVLLD